MPGNGFGVFFTDRFCLAGDVSRWLVDARTFVCVGPFLVTVVSDLKARMVGVTPHLLGSSNCVVPVGNWSSPAICCGSTTENLRTISSVVTAVVIPLRTNRSRH